MSRTEYTCKVCDELFSEKLKDDLIEHLRDHYENSSFEADLAEQQLEDLGSNPE